jgi:hypothetical protein
MSELVPLSAGIGVATVTRALAFALPPGPVAVIV